MRGSDLGFGSSLPLLTPSWPHVQGAAHGRWRARALRCIPRWLHAQEQLRGWYAFGFAAIGASTLARRQPHIMRRFGRMRAANSSRVRCSSPSLPLSLTFAIVCAMRGSLSEIPDAPIMDLSPAAWVRRLSPVDAETIKPAYRRDSQAPARAPIRDIGVEAVLQWLSSCWYSAENDMCACGQRAG